jgi:hypothetical protein
MTSRSRRVELGILNAVTASTTSRAGKSAISDECRGRSQINEREAGRHQIEPQYLSTAVQKSYG